MDEAHGGHMRFLPEGAPKSALASGADLAVQSCHKTLGSLVGSAQLHVGRNSLVSAERVQHALNFLQTTSPNYLLLASLDVMRRWLWREGESLFAKAVDEAKQLESAIDAMPGLSVFRAATDPRLADHRQDPLRLVVNVSGTGWSGYEVERHLRTEFQVEDEMADWFNVVYVLSPHDDPAATERLLAGLAIRRRSTQIGGEIAPSSRATPKRHTCCSRRFRRWRWRRATPPSPTNGRRPQTGHWPNLCGNGYVLSSGHSAVDAGRSRFAGNARRLPATAGRRRKPLRKRPDIRNDSSRCSNRRRQKCLKPLSQPTASTTDRLPSACPFRGTSIQRFWRSSGSALFAAGPTYSGHKSLVKTDGDYFTLGGLQAGKLLVRNNGRPQLVSNVCRHRQSQMLTGCGPREEYRLPGPQLGLRSRRLPGRRAALREESVPRSGANRTRRVERPAVRRPARRPPRTCPARQLDGTRHARTTCSSASMKKSTTSTGRSSSKSIWKTTTSAPSTPASARSSIPPISRRVSSRRRRTILLRAGARPLAAAAGRDAAVRRIPKSAARRPRRPPAAVCRDLDVPVPGPTRRVVSVHDGRDHLHAASPTRTRLRSEYYFDREIAETRRDYVETSLAVLDEVTGEDQAAAQKIQNGRNASTQPAKTPRARTRCPWSKASAASTIACATIVQRETQL